MRSIGTFNGITATSLVMCDRDYIDEIYKLTTKHSDAYASYELVKELSYLKECAKPENVAAIKKKFTNYTKVNQIKRQLLLKGASEIVFHRLVAREGVLGSETVEGNVWAQKENDDLDLTSLFADEGVPLAAVAEESANFGEVESEGDGPEGHFDLFGEEEAGAAEASSLFGEDDESSGIEDLTGRNDDEAGSKGGIWSEHSSSINFKTIKVTDLSTQDLISIGFDSINITDTLLEKVMLEFDEFLQFKKFYSARFRNRAYVSMASVIRSGDLKLPEKVLQDKPLFGSAIDSEDVSIFELSLDELNFLDACASDDFDISEVIEVGSDEDISLEYRIYKMILEKIQDNVDYCIDIFREKSGRMGTTSVTILQTPVNKLHFAFEGANFVAKAAALEAKLKAEPDVNKEKIVNEYLSEIQKAYDFIGRVYSEGEIDTITKEEMRNLIGAAKVRVRSQKEYREQTAGIDPRIREFVDMLASRKLLSKNILDLEDAQLKNLYNSYRLYQYGELFSLPMFSRKVGHEFTVDEFVKLNESLVYDYQIIPLTTKSIFSDSVISSVERVNNKSVDTYDEVLKCLRLLEKHYESKKYLMEVPVSGIVIN